MSNSAITASDLSINAPPWDYNPSSWRQRVPICLLAAVAFLIAAYMGLYQWRLIGDVWDPIFGDQSKQVLDSDVSEEMRRWFRIPDAAFGAVAYLGDMIFGLAGFYAPLAIPSLAGHPLRPGRYPSGDSERSAGRVARRCRRVMVLSVSGNGRDFTAARIPCLRRGMVVTRIPYSRVAQGAKIAPCMGRISGTAFACG